MPGVAGGVNLEPLTPIAVQNGEECNDMSNGDLCLKVSGTKATVTYTKTGGPRILAILGLQGGGVEHGSTPVWLDAGHSATFNASYACGTSVIGWIDVANSRRYQTPPVKTC